MTRICITGGAGYLGYHIGKTLRSLDGGNDVIIFDKVKPPSLWKDDDDDSSLSGFTYIKGVCAFDSYYRSICPVRYEIDLCVLGDVRDINALEIAFKSVDCVIHSASFGMSNEEQLAKFWRDTEEINVTGTKNVIEACCRQNVPSLVYSSTNNVVFNGQEIRNGDESLPYTPLLEHSDHYSRTKSIAEQIVLMVDKKLLANGGTLRTCALRLGGLVGPKDRRHILRSLHHIRMGFMYARFWHNDGLGDFVLIHNAVSAHILAAKALGSNTTKEIVGGQSYFISEGQPINICEFFTNIGEELGYSKVTCRIPVCLVHIFVTLTEWLNASIPLNFPILLTKSELLKVVTTNYFSIEKARKELGYNPTRPNDITEIVQWLRQSGYEKSKLQSHQNNAIRYTFKFLTLVLVAIIAIIFISN